MRKIESNDQTLSSYLKINSESGILNIPFSQRPYEWETIQVTRLFNDLVNLKEDSDDFHMLNFFTLSKENEITKIFDGQQRTITSLLIISAFARKLNDYNEYKASNHLIATYLVSENPLTGSKDKKLNFENEETNLLFYELIQGEKYINMNSNNYSDKTQKYLILNYQLINELLDNYIEENDLNSDQIKKLIVLILDHTQLITIYTYTDELAMAMFESLNNTGKSLESYYVLKNDFVQQLGEQIVKDKWNTIDNNLSNYDPSAFLLAISTILTGKSSKKNSLERIYGYQKENNEDMNMLLELLLEGSEKYLHIRNPAQFVSYNSKADLATYKKLIDNVQIFITSQHHPLILAMLIKKEPLENINKVLNTLLNLGIRNFYFKEIRANTIEVPIANIANKYYLDEFTVFEVIKQINSLAIKDDELREAILAKKVTKSSEKGIKFILRETFNSIDLKKETQITESLSSIHLEHILPQKPGTGSIWMTEFPNEEEREFFIRKIGNTTLLLDRTNSSISNRDFNVKKLQYSKSDIPENKNISNNDKWGKEEINTRTIEISKKIIHYLQILINSTDI